MSASRLSDEIDVNLSRAVFWNVKQCLSRYLTTIKWGHTFVSVYSQKIQTRVKIGLNSKTPLRFPPVVFYMPNVNIFLNVLDTKLIQGSLTGT
jgi:hypothetical protein